jgi:hypothetical protein
VQSSATIVKARKYLLISLLCDKSCATTGVRGSGGHSFLLELVSEGAEVGTPSTSSFGHTYPPGSSQSCASK